MKKAADLRGKIFNTKAFVEYQKSAVVSRELINKKTGTVTVFSFDKGEGLSEHTAPFDALVCVLDGKVSITISGKSYVLMQGEFLVLPAGKPHALKSITKFKMMLVMIRS
ncbi:MAG: cupin [Candidatus Firestonebacteria bacterium RIFOXYC2_FULL_39_67]|nr:MAG: cupin [Candidatus Firestonebacteria bacterium RIFOXYD2_FULL_39_29]OGF56060.1 MAG: cupin [Candidatus Firestonebacteria bacterium RIFOXYC2_FULL_39_67]